MLIFQPLIDTLVLMFLILSLSSYPIADVDTSASHSSQRRRGPFKYDDFSSCSSSEALTWHLSFSYVKNPRWRRMNHKRTPLQVEDADTAALQAKVGPRVEKRREWIL